MAETTLHHAVNFAVCLDFYKNQPQLTLDFCELNC